jgi:hypothetical protein
MRQICEAERLFPYSREPLLKSNFLLPIDDPPLYELRVIYPKTGGLED